MDGRAGSPPLSSPAAARTPPRQSQSDARRYGGGERIDSDRGRRRRELERELQRIRSLDPQSFNAGDVLCPVNPVALCLCVSVSLCLCVSVSLCLCVSVSLCLCVSVS
eukprot:COSAG02_NODE_11437_length_1723_cov_13.163793_1_plen_107_part_10